MNLEVFAGDFLLSDGCSRYVQVCGCGKQGSLRQDDIQHVPADRSYSVLIFERGLQAHQLMTLKCGFRRDVIIH